MRNQAHMDLLLEWVRRGSDTFRFIAWGYYLAIRPILDVADAAYFEAIYNARVRGISA